MGLQNTHVVLTNLSLFFIDIRFVVIVAASLSVMCLLHT